MAGSSRPFRSRCGSRGHGGSIGRRGASVLAGWGPVVLLGSPTLWLAAHRLATGPQGFDRTGLRLGALLKPAFLLDALIAGQTSYPWNPVVVIGSAVLLVCIAAALWRARAEIRFGPALAIWLPVAATACFVTGRFSAPHYYLSLVTGFAVLMAWLGTKRGPGRIALLAFLVMSVVGLVNLERGREYQREEFLDPWRELTRGLESGGADVVLSSHPSVVFYARGDRRFGVVTDPPDLELPRAGSAPAEVWAVVAPLSGAQPALVGMQQWLADSMSARHYRAERDSGLVQTRDAARRRRFSSRSYPEWRVRLLTWRREP